MNLHNFIQPESVLCNVDAGSRKHAIEIISKLLMRCDSTLSADEIFASLIERERLGCTAMENGIAIPHARFADATHPIGAFVRLSEAVEFDTPDDELVDLVFGLVVPEDAGDEDLEDFKLIMDRFSDVEFLQSLRGARTSKDLYLTLTATKESDLSETLISKVRENFGP